MALFLLEKRRGGAPSDMEFVRQWSLSNTEVGMRKSRGKTSDQKTAQSTPGPRIEGAAALGKGWGRAMRTLTNLSPNLPQQAAPSAAEKEPKPRIQAGAEETPLAERLATEFPGLAGAQIDDQTPLTRAKLPLAPIGAPGEEIFLMAGMWADRVGDVSASIRGTHNLTPVFSHEFSAATNMTTEVQVYRRTAPGPVAILVAGSDSVETHLTLFTHA
jgi:hypothetical protein